MNENKNKILIVEDEENLRHSLQYNLEAEDFTVTTAIDGISAVNKFSEENYDLIILDIMLPKLNGFEVLKKIRTICVQTPVLILTARASLADRIQGLELGADDYLTKPFHLEELILRVGGMLRRKHWYTEIDDSVSIFSFGDNTINFNQLMAKSGDYEFPLTSLEASLLSYFVARQNTILTKEELLANVWNIDPKTETRTIENFMVRLRKFFEPMPAKPIYFKTIRSRGYMFTSIIEPAN